MISENLVTKIAETMKVAANYKKNGETEKATIELEKLDMWRAIKNEFKNEEIRLKTENPNDTQGLNDARELNVLMKMREQRSKDMNEFAAAGRKETVEKLRRECEFLDNLIPKEPSEDEIRKVIEEFAAGKSLQMKDMKDVQAFVRSKFPSVNGGKVTQIFRATFGL